MKQVDKGDPSSTVTYLDTVHIIRFRGHSIWPLQPTPCSPWASPTLAKPLETLNAPPTSRRWRAGNPKHTHLLEEVEIRLQQLHNGYACGWQGLTPKLLLQCQVGIPCLLVWKRTPLSLCKFSQHGIPVTVIAISINSSNLHTSQSRAKQQEQAWIGLKNTAYKNIAYVMPMVIYKSAAQAFQLPEPVDKTFSHVDLLYRGHRSPHPPHNSSLCRAERPCTCTSTVQGRKTAW